MGNFGTPDYSDLPVRKAPLKTSPKVRQRRSFVLRSLRLHSRVQAYRPSMKTLALRLAQENPQLGVAARTIQADLMALKREGRITRGYRCIAGFEGWITYVVSQDPPELLALKVANCLREMPSLRAKPDQDYVCGPVGCSPVQYLEALRISVQRGWLHVEWQGNEVKAVTVLDELPEHPFRPPEVEVETDERGTIVASKAKPLPLPVAVPPGQVVTEVLDQALASRTATAVTNKELVVRTRLSPATLKRALRALTRDGVFYTAEVGRRRLLSRALLSPEEQVAHRPLGQGDLTLADVNSALEREGQPAATYEEAMEVLKDGVTAMDRYAVAASLEAARRAASEQPAIGSSSPTGSPTLPASSPKPEVRLPVSEPLVLHLKDYVAPSNEELLAHQAFLRVGWRRGFPQAQLDEFFSFLPPGHLKAAVERFEDQDALGEKLVDWARRLRAQAHSRSA